VRNIKELTQRLRE
jgi:hypothetical protein